MPKKQLLILAAFFVLIGLFAGIKALWGNPSTRPHFSHAKLTITHSGDKVFHFDAEVAQTAAEQSYGLMFVRSMPDGTGMIFPYNPPQIVAFWMKNTYIPLDMLFIRPGGTIGRIVANAKPLDLTPIPSQTEVSAVIEINGGEAARDGIAVGDRVDFSALP